MSDRELDAWIEGCAQYLIEKRERVALRHRPRLEDLQDHPDKARCHLDFEQMTGELESLERMAKSLSDRLGTLSGHFELGRLVPFDAAGHDVIAAREAAVNAWVAIRMAQQQIAAHHPPATRALELQQSAVRLAFAYCGQTAKRKVRSIAKRIMVKAGLSEPDEKSITTWLDQMMDEADK